MMSHTSCPKCGSRTKLQNTEAGGDTIRRVRTCHECPTQFTVVYAEPLVTHVKTVDND